MSLNLKKRVALLGIVLLTLAGAVRADLDDQVDGVTIEQHSKRPGSDYRDQYAPSAGACARLCAEDRRCRAFGYLPRQQRCWLKDRVPPSEGSRHWLSGVKRYDDRPDEVAGVTIERHSNRPGSDYRDFITGSVENCARSCSAELRCRAFAYSRRHDRCYLKNRVPPAQANRRMVSGVKRGLGNDPDRLPDHIGRVSIEPYSDRRGADYRRLETGNPVQCARQCDRDGRCKAFAYQANERRCRLMDWVPRREQDASSVSGVKQGSGDDQADLPDWVGRVRIERHSDRRGSDYFNKKTADAVECARLCDHDGRCRAFAYQVDPHRCWLKNGVPPRYDYGPSVSGVKR